MKKILFLYLFFMLAVGSASALDGNLTVRYETLSEKTFRVYLNIANIYTMGGYQTKIILPEDVYVVDQKFETTNSDIYKQIGNAYQLTFTKLHGTNGYLVLGEFFDSTNRQKKSLSAGSYSLGYFDVSVNDRSIPTNIQFKECVYTDPEGLKVYNLDNPELVIPAKTYGKVTATYKELAVPSNDGRTFRVFLTLTNESSMSGYQCDILLPAYAKIWDNELKITSSDIYSKIGSAYKYTITKKNTMENSYLLMANFFDTTTKTLEAGTYYLGYIDVVMTDKWYPINVSFENCKYSRPDGLLAYSLKGAELSIPSYSEEVTFKSSYTKVASTKTTDTYRVTLSINNKVPLRGFAVNITPGGTIDNNAYYFEGSSLYTATNGNWKFEFLKTDDEDKYYLVIYSNNPKIQRDFPPGNYTIGYFDMTIPKSYTTGTVYYSDALAIEYIGDDKNYEEYLHNIFPNALYINNYDDKVSLYADYEETSSTSTSKTYRVTLSIKSDVDMVGLQTNIMLSYDLKMVANSFNYTNGSLYAAAGNKFSTSSLSLTSDGSYLLMINPPAKTVIPPGDYTIGTFDVTTTYPEDNHNVDIRNGLALEPIPNNDHDWYYHYMESFNLRLSEITGDVNRDRRVDISDVVAVINTMAGDRTFVRRADVNTDTMTDISDIVAIINIMANGAGSPFTPRQ